MEEKYITENRYTHSMDKMNTKLDDVSKSIGGIKVAIAEIPEKILEKTDKKYSPMWTANVWKFVFVLAGGGLITAVLTLVIK